MSAHNTKWPSRASKKTDEIARSSAQNKPRDGASKDCQAPKGGWKQVDQYAKAETSEADKAETGQAEEALKTLNNKAGTSKKWAKVESRLSRKYN